MDIGWVWDPKYHYHLDLTNAVPIRAKPPHLAQRRKPGWTYTWTNWWPKALLARFCQGAATLCHAVAPSPGRLVQAALPCMSKHRPG